MSGMTGVTSLFGGKRSAALFLSNLIATSMFPLPDFQIP